MELCVARSFDKADIAIPQSRVSLGIANQVQLSGRALLSVDAGRDERFSGMASVEDLKLRRDRMHQIARELRSRAA